MRKPANLPSGRAETPILVATRGDPPGSRNASELFGNAEKYDRSESICGRNFMASR